MSDNTHNPIPLKIDLVNRVVDDDRDLVFGIRLPQQHRLQNWNFALNKGKIDREEMEQSINNSPLICRFLNTSREIELLPCSSNSEHEQSISDVTNVVVITFPR